MGTRQVLFRVALLTLAGSLACVAPRPPIASSSTPARSSLALVAFLPFVRGAALPAAQAEGVGLIERYVTEALAQRGLAVIPAQELRISFQARGLEIPSSPAVGARRAADDFGATALLVGEVSRYRERTGQRLGSAGPASVAFRVTLHAAPSGRQLWAAEFDETQIAFLDSPRRAQQYPDGGRRWLSAAELAQWGAGELASALLGRSSR